VPDEKAKIIIAMKNATYNK